MVTSNALPEAAVLYPRDPSLDSSDDWAEFRLSDAIVTLPDDDSQTPVSLLLASEHFPLTLTGRLEAPSADLAPHFIKPAKKRFTDIEITEVRSFAYGAYEDGSMEIWAAGKAGWFVVKPSRAYRQIYNDMIEAVNVLFFVVDSYAEPRRKGGRKNGVILPDYGPQELFDKFAAEQSGGSSAEAAERIYRHLDFLLSSMLAGKEGIAWSRNPLFTHLGRKFPNELAAIKERLGGLVPLGPLPHAGRPQSSDDASETSSLKRKRDRPPKHSDRDGSCGIHVAAPRRAKGETSHNNGREPDGRRPVESTNLELPPLRRRNPAKHPVPAWASETSNAHTSNTPITLYDSDDAPPQPPQPHQARSALRLKPSKPAKGPPKGHARSGKAPNGDPEDENEDDLARSFPLPGRRKPSDPSRRRPSRNQLDEGIDIPTSPSDSTTPPNLNPSPYTAPSPNSTSHHLDNPDPLHADTWTCALDGCTHKVFAASDPASQRLIREHYALHAYDDDERVRMVAHMGAPALPVAHLMQRVRSEARLEGFPGSRVAGTRFASVGEGEGVRQRY